MSRIPDVPAAPVTPPRPRIDAATAIQRVQEWFVLGTGAAYSAGHASVGLILLLASAVAEAVVSRRIPWRRSALDAYLLAFIVIATIAGILSPFQSAATGSAALAALTIYVAYGIVYRTLSRNTGLIRPLLGITFWGGVVAAGAAAFLFVADGGPQAKLPALGPNALGSTLLIALVIGAGLLLWPATSLVRYATGSGAIVILVSLLLTLSRGAWIGAVVGVVILILLAWRGRVQPGSGHRRAWLVALAAVAILAGGITVLGGEPAVLQKKVLSIINPWRNRERLFLARSALAIAADHPLVGSGLNTFVLIHPHPSLRADPLASKPKARVQSFAHNIFLNMAAEVGVLGLAAFVAILIRGAAAGWRWYAAASGHDRIVAATVLASFSGLLIHQLFDGTVSSVHISAGLWFLLAIMLAREPARPGPP